MGNDISILSKIGKVNQMSVAITEKIHEKLEEIGFGENEITTFQLINELKTRQFQFDIKQLINKIAFRNLSEGIAATFEKNKWSEEDFFNVVETCRREKKI